jgi:hypothetical protein
LLEFQSSVDRFMVVRVLNYITDFYLDYVATHKRVKRLPAVFPVVLYNGKQKWTSVQEIADLIEPTPALGQYALYFRYLLLNEKSYSRQQLLAIRNIVSTLFLAEAHYDIKLLETELLNLYEQEEDKQAVSLFLNWFRQLALYGKVSPEDYGKLDYVYRTKGEVQTMLTATLEEERKKIYLQGEAAGLAKGEAAGLAKGEAAGLAKGRVETQQQMIGQLLRFRFELAETEQIEFVNQVALIQELQHLDELVDILLNKTATLVDFVALLQAYLPVEKVESSS